MASQIMRNIHLGSLSGIYLIRALAAKAGLKFNPPQSDDRDELTFVIYSITPWKGVWQRPQHFTTRLAKKYRVIYVDPYGLQHCLTDDTDTHREFEQVTENLYVFRPKVLPGGKVNSRITSLNDAMIVRNLTKLFKKLNFGQPVLVTNTPLTDEIADLYPWKAVVYDVIDDFVKNAWVPPDAVEREIRLFKRANTVFTGTYSLWDKKRALFPEAEYIPCGVETDHFQKANDPDLPLPDDLKDIPGPMVGFFGGLNDRIDHDLLVKIAASIPECSVVLLGPIFASFGLSDFKEKWASLLPGPNAPGYRMKPMPGNLHIMGIRKYQELPHYLKAFDVCLIPFVLSDVTIDIHPVKILEYLAAGRPVVSTPLPDMKRFYQDIVPIAETHDEFVAHVREYLSGDTADAREKRVAFAAPKTWENMAERMIEKILSIPGVNRNSTGQPDSDQGGVTKR